MARAGAWHYAGSTAATGAIANAQTRVARAGVRHYAGAFLVAQNRVARAGVWHYAGATAVTGAITNAWTRVARAGVRRYAGPFTVAQTRVARAGSDANLVPVPARPGYNLHLAAEMVIPVLLRFKLELVSKLDRSLDFLLDPVEELVLVLRPMDFV